MKEVIQARDLRKIFKFPERVEVLKGVSLDAKEGESIAITGASGEGKSTLLHILGTLEEPTSGRLFIANQAVDRVHTPLLRNRHLGFIFQTFNLLEDYSALQNILMPAFIAGDEIQKNSTAWKRAHMLLEKVGLLDRAYFPTKVLSGGEKQRIALARALCNDPQIILADEPSGNLDHKTSEQIHQLLFECVKTFNKTLIVVTHDQQLARMCDRTLHLSDGIITLGNSC